MKGKQRKFYSWPSSLQGSRRPLETLFSPQELPFSSHETFTLLADLPVPISRNLTSSLTESRVSSQKPASPPRTLQVCRELPSSHGTLVSSRNPFSIFKEPQFFLHRTSISSPTPQLPKGAPDSPREPPLFSSLTPPGPPGPGLTPRLLHGAPVQLAVALQRGDVRGAADLGRRRPTPRPASGSSFLLAPAPAAAPAPLLRKPHHVKFLEPRPPLRSRRVPGLGKQAELEAGPP